MKNLILLNSIACVVLLFVLLWLYFTYDSNIYRFELLFLLLSYIPFSLIYIAGIATKGSNILHPFLMVSLLYFLLFILSPMVSIILGDTKCHGDSVMDGCVKGTTIFIIGYAFFTLGYIVPETKQIHPVIENPWSINRDKIIRLLYILWIIGAISCIYYIHKSSVALVALLTNDSTRIALSLQNVDSSNVKFLSNFAYLMILPCIILLQLKPQKKVYALVFITLFLFYLRGTRIFIVILLVAGLIVYIRTHNYHIKFYQVIVGLVCFLCIIGFLGSNRNNIKSGKETTSISMNDIAHALSTNLDLYKPYYGLVANCPQKTDHTYGQGMFLDSFVSLIPRFLWPNKRTQTPMTETIKETTGNGPIRAGMSWPNIAEFYMDFGVIGVMLFCSLFGYLISRSISLLNSDNLKKVILYAILFPTYFQLVIRGYTPINFIMYVCLLFPYLAILPYQTKRI